MRMRNCVLFGVAFASMAAYAEPINLGCSARGPLAALSNSAAFREAIGDANPANFLGSVYDVNGQQLSPQSSKAMQCPLFIDSDATPSAAASKAILRAEASIRTAKPEPQSTAPAETGAIVISSAAGVVFEIPQQGFAISSVQDRRLDASKPETGSARTRRNIQAQAAPASVLKKEEIRSEAAKMGPEPTAHVEVAQHQRQVEVTGRQSVPAIQPQESLALSLGRTLGLIRQVETRGRGPVLEIDPLMMFVYFLALFVAVGVVALLVFTPRAPATPAQRRLELLEAESMRFAALDRYAIRQTDVPVLKMQKPVQTAPRRVSPSLVAGD